MPKSRFSRKNKQSRNSRRQNGGNLHSLQPGSASVVPVGYSAPSNIGFSLNGGSANKQQNAGSGSLTGAAVPAVLFLANNYFGKKSVSNKYTRKSRRSFRRRA